MLHFRLDTRSSRAIKMHLLLFGMHLSSAGHGSVSRSHAVLLRTGAILEEECNGAHDKETNNNDHSHGETGFIVPIILAYTLLGSRINDATAAVEIERVQFLIFEPLFFFRQLHGQRWVVPFLERGQQSVCETEHRMKCKNGQARFCSR